MNTKQQFKPGNKPTVRPPLPETHSDVALGDINDLRALTRMSASWIHDAVRDGKFPAPVIRKPRCTRWRIADVRNWLISQGTLTGADRAAGERVTEHAKKASAAAKAKRVAGKC